MGKKVIYLVLDGLSLRLVVGEMVMFGALEGGSGQEVAICKGRGLLLTEPHVVRNYSML